MVAIIYMTLFIIFMIVGIVVFIKVYNTVKNAPRRVEETVTRIIDENKGQLMGMAGMAVVSLVAARLKGMFKR